MLTELLQPAQIADTVRTAVHVDKPLITDWLTFWVAIVALFAPLAVYLYRRHFIKPTLEIEPSKTGRAYFFATCGMEFQTTLRAVDGDVFIVEAEAEVRYLEPNAQFTHKLAWERSVTSTVTADGTLKDLYIVPSGFVVQERIGFLFKPILFVSPIPEITTALAERFRNEWNSFLKGKISSQYTGWSVTDFAKPEHAEILTGFENEFRNLTTVSVELHKRLQQDCFWRVGKYSATLTLVTAKGVRFSTTVEFDLSSAAQAELYENAVRYVLREYGRTPINVNPEIKVRKAK